MLVAWREWCDQGFQSAQCGHNLEPLYFPHLTGIDVKAVMKTTEKPTLERVVPCSVWKLDIADEDERSGSSFENDAMSGALAAWL